MFLCNYLKLKELGAKNVLFVIYSYICYVQLQYYISVFISQATLYLSIRKRLVFTPDGDH